VDAPEVHYADAGGVRIAWTQFGDGPDVLAVPPLITNAELGWENEHFRRFFEYMGGYVRVTSFDKRGIGLSDRFVAPPTLEQRCDDIVAVMEAAGLDRPSLLGVSEGGLMTMLFAAEHPGRVDRLALLNAHPGRTGLLALHREIDEELSGLRAVSEWMDRVIARWGEDPQFFVDWFCPSMSSDAAFVRWYGRLQRQSATGVDVRHQVDSLLRLEVADKLGAIRAPTLAVNVAGDRVVPAGSGHYLAERIPGARAVLVPGDDHFVEPTPHWQQMTDTWLEFVTGSAPTRHLHRRMVTVLFSDIVGSTARAAQTGDDGWHRLLDQHDRIVWRAIGRHRGTLVKNTGDGILARFDVPSDALDFAVDIRRQLEVIGLRIRCGLHTGEVELRDNGDITGLAVNLAARVEQTAQDGTIYVTSTVQELVLGGAWTFSDCGEQSLKGFDRPWRLARLDT
jgi:class 3 adenylate cyclase/pimeloyl-ACP methyl ester carboxylesterase